MKAPSSAALDIGALWEGIPPALPGIHVTPPSRELSGEPAAGTPGHKSPPPGAPQAVVAAQALDAHTVSPQAYTAAQAFLQAAESVNTRKAYRTALNYWRGWYALRYGREMTLPVPVRAVVEFLTDHLAVIEQRPDGTELAHYGLKGVLEQALRERGLKGRRGPPALNTVRHRIAVLSQLHEGKRLANPCRDIAVKRLLASARKVYGATDREAKAKQALTEDLLRQLLNTCKADFRGTRDRALLTLAFASGGRRRSEVISLRVEDLHRKENGNYAFVLGVNKTDPRGERKEEKPVNGEAAEALSAWLALSGLTEGPLFRKIIRGQMQGALTGDGFWWMVRRRAREAGLNEEDFGAHSLRSGFVTEAARRGIGIAEVMKLTGHRSVKTTLRYYQVGEVSTLAAANLLPKTRR